MIFFIRILTINLLLSLSVLILLPEHIVGLIFIATTCLVWLFWVIRHEAELRKHVFISLESGLMNLADGNYAFSLINEQPSKENHALFQLFNDFVDKLHDERIRLHQREMLLNKVINAAPILAILVNHRGHVIFANEEAEKQLGIDTLLGSEWLSIIEHFPDTLRDAITQPNLQSTFVVTHDQTEPHAWHVNCSNFPLNQMPHTLYLFEKVTEPLNRQELITWKKALRVINHELNNSLAPISSMCYSGKQIANTLNEERLEQVFATISKRVKHLDQFLKSYSSLAKLKTPIKSHFMIDDLLTPLSQMFTVIFEGDLPSQPIFADQTQIEQVLINLLKNAHEAAPDQPITIKAMVDASKYTIAIIDQGAGMSDAILASSTLPFYSTKEKGSGLGLTLCREIIELHGGKMQLTNLETQGLQVTLQIPID
ncbi:MAG: ATP-binding protein [Pseudomonadota bacterium]